MYDVYAIDSPHGMCFPTVLTKLKLRGFRATSLSTHDFSTLYTTLPHNLIKEKLVDLIERAFKQFYKNEGTLYLACNNKRFSLLQSIEDINFGLVRMYVAPYRDDSLTS